jgi:hypothetical protein
MGEVEIDIADYQEFIWLSSPGVRFTCRALSLISNCRILAARGGLVRSQQLQRRQHARKQHWRS